jgi:DNA-directed RNA polymerase specialized sigma24 family protein
VNVTDAPAAPGQVDPTEAALASFRRQLEGQVSVPASVVQDALLDLWGHLPEGEIRSEVERWLTETLERSLYSVGDVDARLANVLPAD